MRRISSYKSPHWIRRLWGPKASIRPLPSGPAHSVLKSWLSPRRTPWNGDSMAWNSWHTFASENPARLRPVPVVWKTMIQVIRGNETFHNIQIGRPQKKPLNMATAREAQLTTRTRNIWRYHQPGGEFHDVMTGFQVELQTPNDATIFGKYVTSRLLQL